jgi:hypothetical protein
MTTADTTAKPSDEGKTTPGLTPEENVKPEQTDPPENANAEAAKYRSRLRETEAERDTLTGRLEKAHRTMVETIAGKRLEKPEALWAAGVQLEDLLDDEGHVDAEKVEAAAVKAEEELGLIRRRGAPIIPGQGGTPSRGAGFGRRGFDSAFSPR